MMMTWQRTACTSLCALALLACGDDDTGAATSGFPVGPSSTSTGGQGGGAASGGGGSGGTMTTASGGSGGGGMGGGFGSLDATLVSNDLVVECQTPDMDPVEGSFTAAYDNSAGAVDGLATVLSSRVVFISSDQSQMLTWVFGIDPMSSGVVAPGDSIQVVHGKLVDMGGGQGMGPPCNYCGGGTWTLEVAWDIAGQQDIETLGPSPVPCN